MPVADVIENGDRQSVVLPPGIRLEGTEVLVKQDGDAVLLIPVEAAWKRFRRSVGAVSDDFMQDREQPEEQQRGGVSE